MHIVSTTLQLRVCVFYVYFTKIQPIRPTACEPSEKLSIKVEDTRPCMVDILIILLRKFTRSTLSASQAVGLSRCPL